MESRPQPHVDAVYLLLSAPGFPHVYSCLKSQSVDGFSHVSRQRNQELG